MTVLQCHIYHIAYRFSIVEKTDIAVNEEAKYADILH